jgi:mannose-6-phosphate isomerase-like protein (cupin superfamily)
VHSGAVEMRFNGRMLTLGARTFFSTSAGARLRPDAGSRVACFQREGHRGYDTLGVVEQTGRLRYIDGCWDSVLVSPPRKGDACLNALWIPEGVHQTMHTHPSVRAGIIIKGDGVCQTNTHEHPLQDGMIFFLPKHGWHKFRTDLKPATINLVAFHPDSDHGPSDEEHPMLNRTMVDGVSAKDMPGIRTK